KKLQLVGTYSNRSLKVGKEVFTPGVALTHRWGKVRCREGSLTRPGRVEDSPACGWPEDNSRNVLLGERLAAQLNKKPGDSIEVAGRTLTISGLLSTGAAEDDQIVAPLPLAQEILGKPGAVRRVYVSALTK